MNKLYKITVFDSYIKAYINTYIHIWRERFYKTEKYNVNNF